MSSVEFQCPDGSGVKIFLIWFNIYLQSMCTLLHQKGDNVPEHHCHLAWLALPFTTPTPNNIKVSTYQLNVNFTEFASTILTHSFQQFRFDSPTTRYHRQHEHRALVPPKQPRRYLKPLERHRMIFYTLRSLDDDDELYQLEWTWSFALAHYWEVHMVLWVRLVVEQA